MKKILLFLCCFFIVDSVEATTYYSDYYLVSEWDTNYVLEDEVTKVNEEVRYKFYNEKKVYGTYEDSLDYPLIDYDDYIEVEGQCSNDYKENSIEKTVYYYKDLLPSRYLSFENLNGSNGSLRISEIKIMKGNYEIPYSIIACTGCNNTFKQYIHNGVYKENMSSVSNGGSFTLDLGSGYYLNDLIIYLSVYDSGSLEETMTIKLLDASDVNYVFNWQTNYGISGVNNIEMVSLDKNSFKAVTLNYTNEIMILEKPPIIANRVIRSEKQYCDVVKKYRHYRIEKEYSDEYLKEGNDIYPYCDYDESLTYYQVFKRDYLEVQDNILLTSKDMIVEDFIKSNLSFEVTSDLDKNVNGVYQITIKSPINTIITNATVDILENTITESLKEINKEFKNLEEQITNLKDYVFSLDNNSDKITSLIDSLKQNASDIEEIFKETEDKVNEIDDIEIKKQYDEYLNYFINLKNNLSDLEIYANKLLIIYDKNNSDMLDKDKQIEALLREIESLKNLNQFLENEKNLLTFSKKDMQNGYIKEIDSLNNQLQNNKCDEVSLSKGSIFEIDSLYYIGFGFIILGLIFSFIVLLKKNN